ncbi:NAD(P)-dependent oxidoreductase [Effusibacillus lacus]|uniref:Ketol-acid reductoisomerase n=1 Tax=Effusibacillus lacus TaxID=1348429 RepID=A0A292YR13_9BACL|nr:NAD(P)-dependent oxidoreductase [Effusibacillus lacus]TCS76142.1 acetohydroxy acid isomeroreductase-like protein [Effusibacillus lacus]GAX91351.1 ketol-acid reductoisomerase [Effusibacillus lacus]
MQDQSFFAGKTVAILGYDSTGQKQAKKLRDIGIRVIVGVREGWNQDLAKQDGFEVYNLYEAVQQADIVQVW